MHLQREVNKNPQTGNYYKKSTSFIKSPPPEQSTMFKILFQRIPNASGSRFEKQLHYSRTEERIFNHQHWEERKKGVKVTLKCDRSQNSMRIPYSGSKHICKRLKGQL